jgi:exodeoxyribonuclease VII large subunit
MEQQTILTVSDVTRYIKLMFDQDDRLRNCWVRGEISNFTHHSSGHMYFTLKDSGSRLKSIMFKSANRSLAFLPKDGMKVIVRGYVSVFERDGQYQLYVEEMQPDGLGALYLAFQQLKERLEQEGLFAPERKRPLPAYPRTIGVITSPTGAAVRDIITTIRRRYPVAHVILHPVLVQGPEAAPSIALAIQTMNALAEVDVLIVGRGGGSLEELWAFNEEVVARAIFDSNIPVISAVGHETDFTIADFVADVRAATPTAAAELAVPHLGELTRYVYQLEERMTNALSGLIRESKRRLKRIEQSTVFLRPKQAIAQKRQWVDHLENELELRLTRLTGSRARKLADWMGRLQAVSPVERLKRMEQQLQFAAGRLQTVMVTQLEKENHRYERLLDKMHAYSPLLVMKRGYALVYRQDGKDRKLVRSLRDVQLGDFVQVRLQDGHVDCHVWGLEEAVNDPEK